jgi:hypothetical protein
MRIRKIILPAMLLISLAGFAQDRFLAGVIPKINISTKISGDLKLTGNIEARNIFYEEAGGDEGKFGYKYQLLEASGYLSVKTRVNHSLTGGYLLRSRDGRVFHRFIQQYSVVNRFEAFRLGHRFAADQTIDPDHNWEIRTRYRLTVELPLSGDQIDPKEFYLKFSNEYLGIFGKEKPDLEIRLGALIGYEAGGSSRLELGPGYRVNDFSGNGIDQAFWLSLNWYFTVD